MAPMRGLSRAIVCVAATIIAIRFALHQRSVGESTTEPAKPTVRAHANAKEGSWLGVGRFAYEHWVHSHPDVRPCDVLGTIRSIMDMRISRRRTTEYASRRRRDTVPATLTTSIQVWVGVPAASRNARNWTRSFLSGPTYMARRHRRTRGSSRIT